MRLTGDIDAANVEFVTEALRLHITSERPLVIDTSALDFMSVVGFRALLTIEKERRNAGTHWTIVYGKAMKPYLRAFPDSALPLVSSEVDAVQRFESAVRADGRLPRVMPTDATRC
ncbi:STAS domain-containing protein [Mycolicibacterium thermoresistibile]